MVFRMELTRHEDAEILDTKYSDAKTTVYTFQPGNYEVFEKNLMLKSLLPDEVKVNITVDDSRLRSNITTNKTIRFTKTSFYIILGFTESHSGVLSDIEGFVQLIPGIYKSQRLINFAGIGKNSLGR